MYCPDCGVAHSNESECDDYSRFSADRMKRAWQFIGEVIGEDLMQNVRKSGILHETIPSVVKAIDFPDRRAAIEHTLRKKAHG